MRLMETTKKFIRGCVAIFVVAALFLSLIPLDYSYAEEEFEPGDEETFDTEGNEASESSDSEDVSRIKVTTRDQRVFGETRYDTAFEIANHLSRKFGLFDSIIVTYGGAYPDALSGSYLAYEEDAPVLLINHEREEEVLSYIRSHLRPRGTVYILGGNLAVSEPFEKRLTENGIDVQRLAGRDRYATNKAILEENLPREGTVLICSGKGFADSLSASATGLPIMLVGDYLDIEQLNLLRSIDPSKIYIIGGIHAVGTQVALQLSMTTGLHSEVIRLGGETRFDTSVLIAEEFFAEEQDTVVFTDGMNYPDGLSGASLAIYYSSPILLINNHGDVTALNDYVNSVKATNSYTLGGPYAVSSEAVQAAMQRYIDVSPNRPRQDIGTAEDVLNVMRSWLGYDELVNKKAFEIIDIYNSVLPHPVNYKVKYTDEWCDTCLTAAAIQAGATDLIGRECGVGRHLEIFRRKGIWIEDGTIVPEPGYVVIYNWGKATQPNNWGASHIGYVESVIVNYDDHGKPFGTITVIEGNYTPHGGTNGIVGRRYIPIGYGYIRGFAAPNYPESASTD